MIVIIQKLTNKHTFLKKYTLPSLCSSLFFIDSPSLQRTDAETLPQDDLFETSDFEGDHPSTDSEEELDNEPAKVSNNGAITLTKLRSQGKSDYFLKLSI